MNKFVQILLMLLLTTLFVGTAQATMINWALSGHASQSSTYLGSFPVGTFSADNAIDGNTGGDFYGSNDPITHTGNTAYEWWQVDLGAIRTIDTIKVYNRTDRNLQGRLTPFYVTIHDTFPGTATWTSPTESTDANLYTFTPTVTSGRFVTIQLAAIEYLHLAEVEVWGDDGSNAVPEPATMFLFGFGLLGLAGASRRKV